MANEDRIRQVVAAIEASPQQFDMRWFVNDCGTTFCLAGWALKLAGEDMDYWRSEYWDFDLTSSEQGKSNTVTRMEKLAADWLGLTSGQANYLFYYLGGDADVEKLKRTISDELDISFDVVAS